MNTSSTLIHADCREALKQIDTSSVDSIITDPPYELGFMGKKWDASGIAYDVSVWRECLRVLKPGGHLLSFGGSRTYHRMACAIEDAGFEIRDQIMWLYGSGFPKSLDVSKTMDKAAGDPLAWRAFAAAYSAAIDSSSLTHADIDRTLGIKSSSCYWARSDHRGGMPPRHHWENIRALLGLPDELTRLYDEAEREIVGQRNRGFAPGSNAVYGEYSGDARITIPATDAAKQWDGWGTALKPAHEPIVVARKPLVGTVAENVQRYGAGALNIDGCRVAGTSSPTRFDPSKHSHNGWRMNATGAQSAENASPLGRWPANLIHDGSEEVLAAFPDAKGQQGAVSGIEPSSRTNNVYGRIDGRPATQPRGDTGTAARFFYCAKASRNDRGKDNSHPTVKPTELMRYLCRLVTPPGGIVLDPFMGSGSTGKAALLEGFRFIGIELDAGYLAIAAARVGTANVPVEAAPASPEPQPTDELQFSLGV